MSLLPTIIESLGSHFLRVIEEEFIKAEPSLKDAIITEVQYVFVDLDNWIHEKLQSTKAK
jgi:hypothetical protein